MAQTTPITPIEASNPFLEVSFCEGKEWKWRAPKRYSEVYQDKINRIRYDECTKWFSEAQGKIQSEKPVEKEKSQIVNRNAEDKIALAFIDSVEFQKRVPTDNDLVKYLSRFWWTTHEGTRKRIFDLLFRPIGDAPSVFDLWEKEEIDIYAVEHYINAFFNPPEDEKAE